MRKAISPVISIILLIMMLLGVVSGTYLWVNSMSTGLTEEGTRQTERAVSNEVPFSIITLVCDSSNDVISMTVINNGIESISGDQLFLLTVSDINGVGLGVNSNLSKNTYDDIRENGVFNLYGSVPGLDIINEQEYIVKITSGTSVQTIVCNAQ